MAGSASSDLMEHGDQVVLATFRKEPERRPVRRDALLSRRARRSPQAAVGDEADWPANGPP